MPMSLCSKTSLPYGCILHHEFSFVNTLHKKSFLPLGRLTKGVIMNIIPAFIKGVWGEKLCVAPGKSLCFFCFHRLFVMCRAGNSRAYPSLAKKGKKGWKCKERYVIIAPTKRSGIIMRCETSDDNAWDGKHRTESCLGSEPNWRMYTVY